MHHTKRWLDGLVNPQRAARPGRRGRLISRDPPEIAGSPLDFSLDNPYICRLFTLAASARMAIPSAAGESMASTGDNEKL
jgi:hypothetical protein